MQVDFYDICPLFVEVDGNDGCLANYCECRTCCHVVGACRCTRLLATDVLIKCVLHLKFCFICHRYKIQLHGTWSQGQLLTWLSLMLSIDSTNIYDKFADQTLLPTEWSLSYSIPYNVHDYNIALYLYSVYLHLGKYQFWKSWLKFKL